MSLWHYKFLKPGEWHAHDWVGGEPGLGRPLAPFPAIRGRFGGGGGCFIQGTQIETAYGLRQIEEIGLNDLVLTKNESTGLHEYRKAKTLFQLQTQKLIELSLGQTVIEVTPQHRFFVENRGWLESRNLQIGDQLESLGPEHSLFIDDVRLIKLDEPQTVYNLEIAGNHNYFVSDKMVLSHNLKIPGEGTWFSPAVCFKDTTQVHTREGLKAIKDVQVGDQVKTVNQENCAIEYHPVVRKDGAETNNYYRLVVGKEDIFCTENHLFWVLNHGWVKAKHLREGDEIYSDSGPRMLRSVERITSASPISVYNIEVKDNENFLLEQPGFLVVDRWSSKTLECLKKYEGD